MKLNPQAKGELAALLQQRLDIIADHSLRQQDPQKQLSLLASISGEIESVKQQHYADMPARLRHFMDQASYQKALEWLKAETAEAV